MIMLEETVTPVSIISPQIPYEMLSTEQIVCTSNSKFSKVKFSILIDLLFVQMCFNEVKWYNGFAGMR